jgi:2-polyprenyl-3-methyl-5-hydroxy-6-metoxy-1,4-benzoquinol methylase
MDYSAIYDPDTDFDVHFTRATGARIARWMRPGDAVLELGCATGAMTGDFAREGRAVTAVDRSAGYLETARGRGLGGVRWIRADLERPLPIGDRYEHVVIANVLHELDDPVRLLAEVAGERLAPGGLVHVSLQNPSSLHRLVALEMGLIDDLYAISAKGRQYATRRLFSVDDVVALAGETGLELAHREGVMLKPLPNAAMADLAPELLAGFVAAARHLPDHCAMNLFAFRHVR